MFVFDDQGAPPCTHYAQHGVCKFGSVCKFDHPMGSLSYGPSATSLVDMPVAPYLVGSTIGLTLTTGGPVSQSSTQPSAQNSGPLTAVTTTTRNNVPHTSS